MYSLRNQKKSFDNSIKLNNRNQKKIDIYSTNLLMLSYAPAFFFVHDIQKPDA
jgi:hypothetical protein